MFRRKVPMSKINPTQLAALQAPATPVAKATTKKMATVKTTNIKPAHAKSTEKSITKVTVKPAIPAKKAPTKPVVAKAKVAVKAPTKENKDKPRKEKMKRDSFTMPKDEYAEIALMKARLLALGQPTKKSELLRAGIKLLATMSDATLKSTLAAIPVIKTGRPNKH